ALRYVGGSMYDEAMAVKTGLDQLVAEDFKRLKGLKVGLLAHQPSVDALLRPVWVLMSEAGIQLAALFGPEHGFGGAAQDMEHVEEGAQVEEFEGVPLYSLYGTTESSLRPTAEQFEGLDVLVVDLQDVGARYYTYAATMGYALETAAKVGLRVLVLDRPNPLGGRDEDVEGPTIQPDFHSFVGAYPMAVRHGLTLAEYAKYVVALQRLDVELDIVPMTGWSRTSAFDDTQLPWVMPSPNMPSLESAWIYPGQCLLEGTNLSEGRGTTRPFELCGAPYLTGAAWARQAERHIGPGLVLRPTVIKPMFQKHANRECGAVQVHITDRWAVRSMRLTTALMWAARQLAPEAFGWRTQAYEFIADRLAVDLLYGSARPREIIDGGGSVDDVMATFAAEESAFREQRRPCLIY
ncbi:MAG: DUF1343 domain-containing protein, partial [Myxococcota bacterium]